MQRIVTDRVVWSICHSCDPYKHGWFDPDAIWVVGSGWLKKPCIRWGSRSPIWMGNFGGKVHPNVKDRDVLLWAVQKWPNWSRCHLGCGLGWAQDYEKPCIRWSMRVQLTALEWVIFLGEAAAHCKDNDALPWAVHKQVKWSRIEMLFGMLSRVDPRNHILDADAQWEAHF